MLMCTQDQRTYLSCPCLNPLVHLQYWLSVTRSPDQWFAMQTEVLQGFGACSPGAGLAADGMQSCPSGTS
jgi:hypothetical protein